MWFSEVLRLTALVLLRELVGMKNTFPLMATYQTSTFRLWLEQMISAQNIYCRSMHLNKILKAFCNAASPFTAVSVSHYSQSTTSAHRCTRKQEMHQPNRDDFVFIIDIARRVKLLARVHYFVFRQLQSSSYRCRVAMFNKKLSKTGEAVA